MKFFIIMKSEFCLPEKHLKFDVSIIHYSFQNTFFPNKFVIINENKSLYLKQYGKLNLSIDHELLKNFHD